MKKIAILIPCYNEEATIASVIKDFSKAVPEATIYVYDNNSSDNTAEIAKQNGAIVVFEGNQGKGNVIRSMFRDIDADCYLMIDGDNTYPAEFAREMIKPIIDNEADMVIGDRLSSTYFTENKRPFHGFGNKLVRYLINKLFKANVNDIMTGYRTFNKDFVKMFPVMSGGFEIETEMVIHALDKRFKLKEVIIEYKDRPEGSESKLNTYSDGTKVLKTIFLLFKEYRPLLFFSIIALILLIASIGFFIPVLIDYFNSGLVPRFPTLIISSVLGISSIISFFTGLILDLIAQKDKKMFEIYRNINLFNRTN